MRASVTIGPRHHYGGPDGPAIATLRAFEPCAVANVRIVFPTENVRMAFPTPINEGNAEDRKLLGDLEVALLAGRDRGLDWTSAAALRELSFPNIRRLPRVMPGETIEVHAQWARGVEPPPAAAYCEVELTTIAIPMRGGIFDPPLLAQQRPLAERLFEQALLVRVGLSGMSPSDTKPEELAVWAWRSALAFEAAEQSAREGAVDRAVSDLAAAARPKIH